jgi:hypothetical protein
MVVAAVGIREVLEDKSRGANLYHSLPEETGGVV